MIVPPATIFDRAADDSIAARLLIFINPKRAAG